MEVALVQACAFPECGLQAQAVLVQLVRDAPDTKKAIPYCGDHLDVFSLVLVKELLKALEEEGCPQDPQLVAVLDGLETVARARANRRAQLVAEGGAA